MRPDVKNALENILLQNPFMKQLGLELVSLEEGHAIGKMPFQESFCNPYGSLHGGILYSMADIIAGITACSYGSYVSTVDGHMNYILPAMNTTYITCKADVVRQGNHLAVYQVELADDKGNLLQTGTFTFYILQRSIV